MNRLAIAIGVLGALAGACNRKHPAPEAPAPVAAPMPVAQPEAPLDKPFGKAQGSLGVNGGPPPAPARPAESANPLDWRALSADGKTSLEQKGHPNGSCTLTATREGRTLWTSPDCVAKRADMRFLSNDGERVVVLHPVPQGSGTDWRHTEVAHVYRRSKLEWAVQAGGIIQDPKNARISGTSLEWLRGTLATPGRAPRYSPDGKAVQFETIEGQSQEIPLVPKKG